MSKEENIQLQLAIYYGGAYSCEHAILPFLVVVVFAMIDICKAARFVLPCKSFKLVFVSECENGSAMTISGGIHNSKPCRRKLHACLEPLRIPRLHLEKEYLIEAILQEWHFCFRMVDLHGAF